MPPRPGGTASERAAEAARALPAAVLPGGAAALPAAARLFDDVRYGGRAGTREGYEQVRDLDEAIRSARTASVAPIGAGAVGISGAGASGVGADVPGSDAGQGPGPR
jgi:hypothetical protein